VSEPRTPQDLHLRAVKLFAAQLGRINPVWIDQRDAKAGARQHGCRGRAGQSAARDDNVRVPHRHPCFRAAGCGSEY
jgi:hypothetical protein